MKPTIPTPAPRLRLVRRVAGVLATVLLCVVAASRASAATYTWDGGGGNGLWNNAANWNPDGAPTSSIDTSIVLDGSVQLNTNSNVSGNFGMNALTFPATAGAFSIASVGYMSFNTSSTAVVPVLTQNSASNMTLPGIFITGAMTMAGTGTGSVSFAYLQGPLSSAVLTKTSAGTLVLAGDSNGFNGKIMINGGTFQIGNGGAAGSIISGTVIDNATLAFNRSDTYSFDLTVTGTGGVTQKGSGTLVLYRTNTNAGPTLINSGTLQVGDGTTTYASSLGAGDITVNTALVYNRSSSSFAVANNISGPGTVTKLGSGTLTYTGSSSAALTTITGGNMVVATGGQMAGPLLVSAGTSLTVNGTGALAGAGLLTVDGTVASPAVFTLASGSAHARSKVVVGDAGVGSATQSNGNLSGVDQGVILGNTATGSGTYTLSGGSISAGTSAIGSSGAGVFNQTGGSFTTGASVLYVGRFAGASGTFNLSGIGALTTGRTQVSDEANTSIFTQSAGVHTTAVLSLSGRSVSSQGTYNFDGGTLITSQVTSGDNGVHGTSIFNFNGGTLQATASSTTFLQDLTTANVRGTGGVIRGGAAIDTQSYNLTIAQALLHSTIPDDPGIDGGLTKLGSGTLTLSGANTFTGPISIMAGALAVTSESNLGSAGQVAVSGTGQLLFTTSATLTRTYDLGGASLVPAAASVLTLNGATVNGGLLAGSGIFALGPGAVLNNVTALTSSVFMQASGSATMNAGTFRGVLSQNGGTLALSNELVLGSGRLSLGGVVNATELESQGVVTIGNGGTLSATGSALYLTAGGRTTINSGGTLAAGSVTPIELNGSLLVNNGTQTGVLDVNFGSLAKGNGVFGSVNMNDGGRFSPGNSPGTATIGGDFALGAGSRYDFELNQANNTAGDGHADFLSINGVLSFDAGTTANSVFTLGLSTLNSSGVAAALPDFDASHPYTFTLASAAGGITGFAPEEVAIDSSGFRSNLEGGSFAVAQQGNSLILQFTPVPEPSTVAALLGGAVLWGLRRPRRRGVS